MALKDVAYRIHAHIVPWPGYEGEIVSMEAQFKRRARAGQCICQPCFGCREFPAYYSLIEQGDDLPAPFPLDVEIGHMLYDVFDLSRPGTGDDKPSISLFKPRIIGGVMDVPDYFSVEVMKHVKEVGDA
ncbi:MAG TPA: hypothetical protein DCL60_00905 [Armatimonadetes bacterium]|nr:hypothetical protein [Armatimonadota bacterium]